MRVCILQHVEFEGPGSIILWAKERDARVTVIRLYKQPVMPKRGEFDLLIVLGGPMSANDERDILWLVEEKRLIRESVLDGTPVLGICLGAQLMASALGASVYRGTRREIGWFSVYSSRNVTGFQFPETLDAFHWHGETFDLPVGAVRLASSDAYINQAFQIGERAIGLQFHLETTAENVNALVENCGDELAIAPGVQLEEDLRAAPVGGYVGVNEWMARVLAYLTRNNS